MAEEFIDGTKGFDRAYLGSGKQSVFGDRGSDHFISFGDGGEPVPAQSDSGDLVTSGPNAESGDTMEGGDGKDTFEFRALLNAKDAVKTAHTGESGAVNWRGVAGENDNVHDHWVEGWGNATILDYSKADGDKIVIRGHTVEVASITSGSDSGGAFTLITVRSQQGDGGAGGANTETGAHDEDILGTIKVYGDPVTAGDITVKAAGVFDGIDMLDRADTAFGQHEAGITQEVYSNTDGDSYGGILANQTDKIHIGLGSQTVNAGGGNDLITIYSDGGEPDPAQTDGAAGRINPPVPAALSDDIIAGGQRADTFKFNFLLNAREEILDKHTRADGTVNWRKVAGENDNVHDHWVEGIGNDTILDFSRQDGDKIILRGHTVEIASIEHVGDEVETDYTLITVRSQQGDGGGAHDEDILGTIKVLGDKVTEKDIKVQAKGVFDGMDKLDPLTRGEIVSPADNTGPDTTPVMWGAPNPSAIDLEFDGTSRGDLIYAGSGSQTVRGNGGNDRIISFGDAGEPDPAQTDGAAGRVYDALPAAASDDFLIGGSGKDTFEFRALLNARKEVLETHTGLSGNVNWRAVAGENDNFHDHWVEGFGFDTILDFDAGEGDKIVIRGHTVQVKEIAYNADGNYTDIVVISQQGDGGAGGANTDTGAHDEDPLGTIRVLGAEVTKANITVKAANVFDGVDRLQQADKLADYNGGVQVFDSVTDGETIITAPDTIETVDHVTIGAGAQIVEAGVGRDRIVSYSDGGEPFPAQLLAAGTALSGAVAVSAVAVPVPASNDIISGGQDKDIFEFNMLLNARDFVLARHTNDDGSINWRRVAGENDAVHDHWVEGVGKETVLDFSNQDGDQIVLRGHTVEIASIEHVGDDVETDYTLITLRSQQGDGGGAHDEDALGTVKVFGDKVTADDIKVQAKGVFDGVDKYVPLEGDQPNLITGTREGETLTGTGDADNMHGRGGNDDMSGNAGNDFMFGEGGRDTMSGGEGDDWIEGGSSNDILRGDAGNDTLVADSGRDTLTGGADADTFMIENGLRSAVITDFTAGEDVIDLSRIDTVEGLDDMKINQISDTRVELAFASENGKVIALSVQSDSTLDLTAGDFLF